jgi:hydroxymethylbilane synthase
MLVIASRGSPLALWQARWVQEQLAALGHDSRIEIIKTTGDRIAGVPLNQVGTKGLFTKEIEEALLEGRADLAVHSLKDLPTELPAGLTLAAVPAREDPRDAIVTMPGTPGMRLADLPKGAKVGTSSLRRAAQLRNLRPDLRIEPVRGNLDTRLRKLDQGHYDAIVLAVAGLNRLGWQDRIAEIISPDIVCPAVGQGALAIETVIETSRQSALWEKLDDRVTRAATTAERALLATLGGGCQVPVGALGKVAGGTLHLRGIVVSPDGVRLVRDTLEGPVAEATEIGRQLGEALLAAGGDRILESVYG